MKERLVVGVTGSFGSGKSTVGRIFRKLGARQVIDTDRIAHEVFRPTHPVGKKMKRLFRIRGTVKRRTIAGEVFSDPAKRRRLEAIVHPYVGRRVKSILKRVGRGIIILEVPLLFETGFHRFCDVTVAVVAGRENITKRLRQEGFSAPEIRARLKAQLSEAEKKRRSDFCIHNLGSKRLLIQQTKRVWEKLTFILKKK